MSIFQDPDSIKVVESDLDRDSYLALISDALESQGYLNEELKADPDVIDSLEDLTDELIDMAARFPAGTVLERRGDLLIRRLSPSESHVAC